jgi:hypothetical protein
MKEQEKLQAFRQFEVAMGQATWEQMLASFAME